MTQTKGMGLDTYLEAYQRLGSYNAVAKELGVNESTVRRSIRRSTRRQDADPAMGQAMDAIGALTVPSVAWIKTKATKDSPGYSVMLRPQAPSPEDVAEAIRETLGDLPAIPAVDPPAHADADLCTLYPIADAHIGMKAWGRETGEDYDTQIAVERLQSWLARCIAASPSSDLGIILGVGDLLHADDNSNQTPASRHSLDVDTRHFKTVRSTIAALASSIELALTKHNRVLVRILRGNHDEHAYVAVLFALAERFRDNPRVDVQEDPGEFFVRQFGKVLLAAHHGDKAKAERMVLFLADEYNGLWGNTDHRYLWTGHLHHFKAQDIGGVQWEQLRAVTARDAYAYSHAYTARAQLQAITYHREHGEVSRIKVSRA